MNQNWNVEEVYESFEGDMRKLDELIAQMESWCDINTINHKKEQKRLEEYVELSKNLYELQKELDTSIEININLEETSALAMKYKKIIEEKFKGLEETETIIHNWIKEITEVNAMIMRSQILYEHKSAVEEVLNK